MTGEIKRCLDCRHHQQRIEYGDNGASFLKVVCVASMAVDPVSGQPGQWIDAAVARLSYELCGYYGARWFSPAVPS